MTTNRTVLSFPLALIFSQVLVATTALAQEPTPAATPAPAADAPVQPALTPTPEAAPAAEAQPAVTPAPDGVVATGKRSAEETISVTGSRIRRKDLTSQAPLTLISKEQIQQSGRATLGDFLQTLPEQGNAINTSVNNAGDGTTKIDLRGLGASRTLVLVNGRRWVAGGLGADDSVDLNSIPAAAIERIEILKDGAGSAVYGSDAISGVVNIITKKRYDGAEVNGYVGTTTRGDGRQLAIDGTAGTAGERGSMLFSVGYIDIQPVFAGNRSWASPQTFYDASPGGGYVPSGSSTIPEGRILGFDPGAAIPTATPLYNDLVNQNPTASSFIRDPSTSLGWRTFKGSSLPPAGDGYNYQDLNYLTTPSQRFSLFSTGDVKLGDHARAYYEAGFVQRHSRQQLAEEPLVLDPSGSGILTSKDSVYNPFGVDVYVRRRLVEFGPRSSTQDVNTYRVVVGFDGTLPQSAGFLKGWNWDLSLNYGRTQGTQESVGTLRTTRIAAAVGPSFIDTDGVARCGAPGAVVSGCVPLNLFGGPGSITQDQTAGLTFTGTQRIMNALTSVQANTSGDLFKLAASRPVGLALGYEYRFLAGESVPDPIQAAGENSGNNQNPTAGHFYSNEGYAELNVPIVSDVFLLNNLEVTAAVRYFNYNTFGGGATYKVGGLYRPIQGLSLRSTYSTAFRAPSIPDLYTGQSDSFENVSDPCSGVNGPPPDNCGAAANNGDTSTQLKAKVGGNPKLTPETATTFTAGLVFEPGVMLNIKSLKRLSLTVDYYQIAISNAIQTLGANTLLAGCYPTNGAPVQQYCDQIFRDPATQLITRINDYNLNAGKQFTDGIDFALHYGQELGGGNLGLSADVIWLNRQDLTIGSGDTAILVHGAGNFDLNAGGYGGTYPHVKALAGINYGISGFSAAVIGRFIGSSMECGDPAGGGFFSGGGLCYQDNTYQRTISSYFAMDVNVGYKLNWSLGKTSALVGINNLFDAQPPFIGNAFAANTDPMGGYDMMGRFFYVRLSHAL